MPTYPEHLKVFLSCPSDVQKEPKRLRSIIDKLNKTFSGSTHLDLARWPNDVASGMAEDSQDVIDKDIGDYDIYLGIMWRRFGSPTKDKKWLSRTVYEFERAKERNAQDQSNIQIMFYFSNVYVKEFDSEQYELVKKFRDSISSEVIWKEYKSMSKFDEIVSDDLTLRVREFEKNRRSSKKAMQKEKSRTRAQNSEFGQVLFEHDEQGNRINGNIERLIDAVTIGRAITIRVHHPNGTIQVMDAPLLSIENGVVHASDIDQISKTRDADGNYIYQDKSYHYYVIASSSGHFHAKRIFFDGSDRNTTNSKRHIAWIGLASPKS